jgi:hypothetical protein
MEVSLTLAQRDLMLQTIEDQINVRRELILEKNKKIYKKNRVNHFLEDVKEDYNNYYQYIIKEKEQQYNSMMLIKNYLDELIKAEKIANNELNQMRRDQNHILHEMDKIKIELNKLIKLN